MTNKEELFRSTLHVYKSNVYQCYLLADIPGSKANEYYWEGKACEMTIKAMLIRTHDLTPKEADEILTRCANACRIENQFEKENL